jgi:hypothetical protein
MTMNITKERLKELERAERKLNALENGDSMEVFDRKIAQEERIEALMEEIEESFFEGAHESSFNGVGIVPSNDARENACKIIVDFLYSEIALK